jgi:hypothetical protein
VDTCLIELYSFQQALAFISKSYFEGIQVLFPDAARDIEKIVIDADKIVGSFNVSSPFGVVVICAKIVAKTGCLATQL